MARESGGDIQALPEGCIANSLSFTCPRDACRLSVVSSTFRSAAESDAVWESFLPEDYHSIIARSSDPSLLDRCCTKKHLYLSLCENHILIDDGKKSFSLEKRAGKKCYMLSARDLVIVWGDTPAHWIWTPAPASRFPEVAELLDVCWFDISGKIDTSLLSPSTLYAAYLVFQLKSGAYGFQEQAIDTAVGLVGREGSKRSVYLDMQRRRRLHNHHDRRGFGWLHRAGLVAEMQHSAPSNEADGNYPKGRQDGWLEIELGEFFMKEGEDGKLEMRVSEVHTGHWKRGLIVEGIEVRAKAD